MDDRQPDDAAIAVLRATRKEGTTSSRVLDRLEEQLRVRAAS